MIGAHFFLSLQYNEKQVKCYNIYPQFHDSIAKTVCQYVRIL